MHQTFRGINEAFAVILDQINKGIIPTTARPSRYGDVLEVVEPMLFTYTRPVERVLFNEHRDANPFFHLYEALWMLAGRNDVAPLVFYNKRMAEFSDDGKTFNGAYGCRWRGAVRWKEGTDEEGEALYWPTKVDQLDLLVNHLKADPTSRRAVLQMWNVEDDLLKIGPSTPDREEQVTHPHHGDYSRTIHGVKASKDVCCNLSVLFAIKEEPVDPHVSPEQRRQLDMTVLNRSNDAVWGMLGANYVHFTVLQEYLAARLGVAVGYYHHFTNNLHVYRNNWEPAKWLKGELRSQRTMFDKPLVRYSPGVPESQRIKRLVPLVKDPETFERELQVFVELWAGKPGTAGLETCYHEPFLQHVARPMMWAFKSYRDGMVVEPKYWSEQIQADDWRQACVGWLDRRFARREQREQAKE